MAKRSKKRCEELPILHPDAAGIDVGVSELFVAVSADRDPQGAVDPYCPRLERPGEPRLQERTQLGSSLKLRNRGQLLECRGERI